MRDRLIELIKRDNCRNPFTCSPKCTYVISDDCHSERLADLILADGWMRPPCKVGDKVYVMAKTYRGFREAEVKAIYYTEDKKYYPKSHIIIQYDLARGRVRLNFTDFSKTVFLIREEAEQKLRGDRE